MHNCDRVANLIPSAWSKVCSVLGSVSQARLFPRDGQAPVAGRPAASGSGPGSLMQRSGVHPRMCNGLKDSPFGLIGASYYSNLVFFGWAPGGWGHFPNPTIIACFHLPPAGGEPFAYVQSPVACLMRLSPVVRRCLYGSCLQLR